MYLTLIRLRYLGSGSGFPVPPMISATWEAAAGTAVSALDPPVPTPALVNNDWIGAVTAVRAFDSAPVSAAFSKAALAASACA